MSSLASFLLPSSPSFVTSPFRVLVLSALIFALTLAAPLPGFWGAISQTGLDYAVKVGVPLIQKSLPSVSIPDQSGETKVPVLGTINYSFSAVHLKEFNLAGGSLALLPGKGLVLSVNDLSLAISLDFHWKREHFPKASGSGTLTGSMSHSTLHLPVHISESSGHPTFTAVDPKVVLNNLKLHDSGHASWIYNLFMSLFKKKINSQAEVGVEKAITNVVNDLLAHALASLDLKVPIADWGTLDLSLIGPPTETSTALGFAGKGLFEPKGSSSPPFSPVTSLPGAGSASDMLVLELSEYPGNTALYAASKSGKLDFTIGNEDLPSGFPLTLETSYFAFFLPKLAEAYPDNNLTIALSPVSPPTSAYVKGKDYGAIINATYLLDFQILPNSTGIPAGLPSALQMTMPVLGYGKVTIEGQLLAGIITNATSSISFKSSPYGSFDPSILSSVFSAAISSVAVPAANVELAKGFNLPSIANVALQNSTLTYCDGYIRIASDVSYTPPPLALTEAA